MEPFALAASARVRARAEATSAAWRSTHSRVRSPAGARWAIGKVLDAIEADPVYAAMADLAEVSGVAYS